MKLVEDKLVNYDLGDMNLGYGKHGMCSYSCLERIVDEFCLDSSLNGYDRDTSDIRYANVETEDEWWIFVAVEDNLYYVIGTFTIAE